MSVDAMVQKLGGYVDRKGFFKRTSTAAVASTMVLAGWRTQDAQAQCFTHGCNLCRPCNTGCPGGYTCSWCWWGGCHRDPSGGASHRHLCCEGYGPLAPSLCDGNCRQGLLCSFYGGRRAC